MQFSHHQRSDAQYRPCFSPQLRFPAVGLPGCRLFRERLARFLAVCEARLATRSYLADALSIADIALYPIVVSNWKPARIGTEYPALARWAHDIQATGSVAALLPLPA